MAQLSEDYVFEKVKTILPMGDTDLFDDQLRLLVSGAISKMRIEGADIDAVDKEGEFLFQDNNVLGNDYIVCLSYQIMKDMDYDANYNYLTEQYITRVNTIRCYIASKR